MARKNATNNDTHPFAATLLHWWQAHRRELPWRGTADPYAIWLSEIILQQTRIVQGTAYWHRFMTEFPTVERLAAATQDDVLRLWQGLGYYSRARNLHRAARQIVEHGAFPHTFQELKQLPGVGDYTAAAIASMAFGEDVAAVDGNVFRVLARRFGIATAINSTQGKREFTALAQSLLPCGRAADFNQALMDFGAMVCTPQSPHCSECPLWESCEALATHCVQSLPVKERKVAVKARYFQYVYVRCRGHVALHKRGAGDIWQGLWEPLLIEGEQPPAFEGVQALRLGVKHMLTHRRLIANFWLLECDIRPDLPGDYQWIEESQLHRYAVPRLVELLYESLGQ
ncbi:MAG: A/G-specific adenine glycosylase [Muribaculaceae bacterium]|nr:A/G-specific adenine glycosylase [Muribaculaceae bacterium]